MKNTILCIFLLLILVSSTHAAISGVSCPQELNSITSMGLSSITVVEMTGSGIYNKFGMSDSRLYEYSTNYNDWNTAYLSANEYYEIYISNEDGSFNQAGSYITIRCYRGVSGQPNTRSGNNIDAVILERPDGTKYYADLVATVNLGTELSGDFLTNNGYALNSLGAPNSKCTYLGNSYSMLVVGFCNFLKKTNNAQYVSQSVPSTMNAGQSYAVSVTMRNTGTTTWTSSYNHRLGSQNPQDNTIWGFGRVNIGTSESVAPGSTKTFSFTVTAPSSPGTYNFQWRMVQDSVEWFGDYTPNVQVNVCYANGAACSSNSQCCSGSCKADYDGSGSFCADSTQCVHNDLVYSSGNNAPDCCDGGQRRYCNSGTWSCASCGTDTCSGTCGSTVNGCTWIDYYCSSGVCSSSSYDVDTTQTTCDSCKGTGYWSIGGEVSSATCCGDDSGEYKRSRVCNSGSGCVTDSSDDACCSSSTDCVYSNTCYDNSSCYAGLKCVNSTWTDHCSNGIRDCGETGLDCGGSCGPCCLAGGGPCSSDDECCSGSCKPDYDGTGRFCANSSSCVHDGTVYAGGTNAPDCCDTSRQRYCDYGSWTCRKCGEDTPCSGTCGSTLNGCVYNQYSCTSGICSSNPADLDLSAEYCKTCLGTGYWSAGGEVSPNTCCGDDSNEYWIARDCYSGCTTDNSDKACCNTKKDCTYYGTCFDDGSCNENLKCNAGVWTDHCSNGIRDCGETGIDCGAGCPCTYNITLEYTVSDDYGISSCELWTDYSGTWQRTQTTNNVANNQKNYFKLIGVTPGTYKWTVKCTDNKGQTTTASNTPTGHWTFTINRQETV